MKNLLLFSLFMSAHANAKPIKLECQVQTIYNYNNEGNPKNSFSSVKFEGDTNESVQLTLEFQQSKNETVENKDKTRRKFVLQSVMHLVSFSERDSNLYFKYVDGDAHEDGHLWGKLSPIVDGKTSGVFRIEPYAKYEITCLDKTISV